MEVCISSCKSCNASTGSCDKVVIDDVGIALAIAVSSNVSTTTTPVVYDLGYMSVAVIDFLRVHALTLF